MKQKIAALRFMVSTLAVTLALGFVCIAQAASGNTTAALAAQDHTAAMVADWTRAKDYTKEYLDAMPEDGYGFKPTPDIRSFAEQMLHLANANYAFAAAATGIASTNKVNLEKTDSMKTKAACTKAVMDSYDFVISSVKAMDMKKGGEAIKLFGQDTTRAGALAKAFEHQTHHRGQTTIYLRLKGAKPPQEKLF
ncbi:MAG TPA: DinB family protein [Blastocatellia bacterium]|nr:DinB family protein [Blastocatellia bacterium]HMX29203.1 DinB family protein [Blastocatellia bacterium]HMZ17242.1 DinB family protein [Blastocatellia bacterium]HNG28462.1 DinB family protein [Blastocatellia bacterium]